LVIDGTFLKFFGYDRSQRCYQLESVSGKAAKVEFSLQGSLGSPIINPAIMIRNWNAGTARVLINGKEAKNCRVGINHELEGIDLVLFLFIDETKPVKITVIP
jgi:hypothetical protein